MLSEVVCDHISVKGPQIRRMHQADIITTIL